MLAHREARAISTWNWERVVKGKNGRRGACREREWTQMPRAQQPEPNEANRETTPPHFPNLRGRGRHPMKP